MDILNIARLSNHDLAKLQNILLDDFEIIKTLVDIESRNRKCRLLLNEFFDLGLLEDVSALYLIKTIFENIEVSEVQLKNLDNLSDEGDIPDIWKDTLETLKLDFQKTKIYYSRAVKITLNKRKRIS